MDKICVCLGGDNISVDFELCENMRSVIVQSIEAGFKIFFCSGYGNLSFLFAVLLREMQQKGKDIRLVCYIPDLPNSKQYKKELCELNLYDEVYILPRRNLMDTVLFIAKKGQRIIASKKCGIKNKLLLHIINHTKMELFFV